LGAGGLGAGGLGAGGLGAGGLGAGGLGAGGLGFIGGSGYEHDFKPEFQTRPEGQLIFAVPL
jgi:hypothetical protein